MATKTTVTTRTLLVYDRKGKFKITIPAEWKVTFGAFQQGQYNEGPALRIYEAEHKQRACFTGVTSFRDLSIPVERERVSKSGEVSWSQDQDGSAEQRKTKINRSWEKDD